MGLGSRVVSSSKTVPVLRYYPGIHWVCTMQVPMAALIIATVTAVWCRSGITLKHIRSMQEQAQLMCLWTSTRLVNVNIFSVYLKLSRAVFFILYCIAFLHCFHTCLGNRNGIWPVKSAALSISKIPLCRPSLTWSNSSKVCQLNRNWM